MKFSLFAAMAISLVPGWLAAQDAPPPLEAATVLISAPEIDHHTEIEVAYPRPMAGDDAIGKPLAEAPAKITPAWKGDWLWTGPRVAGFKPTEAPKLGTTYVFSVKSGQKDLTGAKVPVDGEKSAKVAGLDVVTKTSPNQENASNGESDGNEDTGIVNRQKPTLLLFNGPVSESSLKGMLGYTAEGGKHIAASWRFARWSELSERSRSHLTLPERILRQTPSLSEDEIPTRPPGESLPWALVVSPESPLPPGENWQLVVASGVAAADGSKSRMAKACIVEIGSVLAGSVKAMETLAPVDQDNQLDITFDKPVAKAPEEILKHVTFSPALPAAPKVEINGMMVSFISPEFKFGVEYKVEVAEGVPASDGLPIAEGTTEEKLVFTPNRPSVALPSTREIQLPGGRGIYPIEFVNVRELQVRIKEIPADDLPRTMSAYAHYTDGMGGEDEDGRLRGFPLASELIPGKTLFEKLITLDPVPVINKSGRYELDWTSILNGRRPAALFVSIEGRRALGQEDSRVALAQAIVQLSDLGLAWKSGDQDMLVYAFSHLTGAPIAGAELLLHKADGQVALSLRTDEQGIARFPRPAEHGLLLAKSGADLHAVEIDPATSNYSPWRLGASYYDWRDLVPNRRAACLFTDRNLYRPGEQVHLAGIVRSFKGSLPGLPENPSAKITFLDDDNRAFFEEDVQLSPLGHFTVTAKLPAEKAGFFRATLVLPAIDHKDPADARTFSQYFQVQDFRRNTFELAMPAPSELTAPETIKSPLTATYFLGSPVAKGAVRWSAHFSSKGFYPDAWRDYLFADHREFDGGYWAHYFGIDYYYSPERANSYQHGEARLDSAGSLDLIVPVPQEKDFPSPRRAFLTAEVTDANQQTLSSRAEILLHPAAFYLGVKRPPDLVRAGDTVALDAVAVNPDGKPHQNDLKAVLKIEKQVWNTVEVRAAGGGMVKRNESHMEPVSEQAVDLPAGRAPLSVSFASTGLHHVTLETKDEAGLPVRTTCAVTVEGKDYYAWEGLEGVRIDLLPDKKIYQPGDTARLLVKSPLEGHALVTIEREGIERAFTVKLQGSAPVIEVPLTDTDAPNTHVGVMIVSGTEGSKMKHPMPQAKFGYTRLTVEQRLPKLKVTVEPTQASVRPGAEATVEVKVADHTGKPVANAGVVLYAVDEGVLSVMGYENPAPLDVFHPQRNLRVLTSATFPDLLAEDPESLSLYNKGYVVGGGGEMLANVKPRNDFKPCAYWNARLSTNAKGTCSATFPTPDTLTRYRLIAVVSAKDGWRFGTGTGGLEVTKPLMLDPSAPRFAHVGDVLKVRALVVNRSPAAGLFSVMLQPDSLASLESAPRAEVAVPAGESKPVEFSVKFNGAGRAKWNWQATPVKMESGLPPGLDGEMNDAVDSSFDIVNPIPVLRETFSARLTPENKEAALLDAASPNLRAGSGEVRVTVANTRLAEGLGAVQQLLHYPYGCVEQTTSSMMPWLALSGLRELLPDAPSDEDIHKAVATGIARLATMQTQSGGLSYWPDGAKPDFWGSVHAAHVLVLAKQAGHAVPDALMDPLAGYLAASLPGIMESNKDGRNPADRVHALLVLTLAGKGDAAYLNRLFDARATLPEDARLYLSMAYAASQGGQARARELLAMPPPRDKPAATWYPANALLSLRLQAAVAAALDRAAVDPLVDEMMLARSPAGDWGSTYTNASGLHALAAFHQAYEKSFGACKVMVTWEGKTRELVLEAKAMQASVSIGLGEIPPQSRPVVQWLEGTGTAYVTTEIAARPQEMPRKRSSQVFGVSRQYQRVQPDGTLAEAPELKVGDLVAVTLAIRATEGRRYIAIDDPLPSSLEAVNPEFTSQGGSQAAMRNARTWASDHTELRDTRALFFCNHLANPGEYSLTYLARVTKAGTVFAPPTKVEAMYDPTLTALGEGSPLTTSP